MQLESNFKDIRKLPQLEMGNALSQIFPPKPLWTAEDMPDLSDKVAVVTGGYAGIGYETAKVQSND